MYKVHVVELKPVCTRNIQNEERFRSFFRTNRCELVATPEPADIVVISTCAVDKMHERGSLELIRQTQSLMKAGARLVVSGCLPAINPQALAQVHDGAVIGARSYEKLNELIDAQVPIEEIAEPLGVYQDYAMITISSGCLSECAYCAIRFAIGRTKSRPVGDIVADVREGLRQGRRKFMLNTDDSGAYGMDLGTNLAVLLERVLEVPGDFQIYITNVHAQWLVKLFPKLEPSLASPKIEGMTSPVQSGSDRILKLMRRWHSAEDYKRCILRVRELNPGLMLRTGVIAGFPSETEEDHARSVELMDTLAYDYAAVFGFSERPGTDIPPELERVPHEVINRRRLELDEVVKTRSRRWTEASPRRTHPFLAAAEARP